MTRKCIVCGKIIRTGRKYCKEHRNSGMGEGARKNKFISENTKRYIKWRIGEFKFGKIYDFIMRAGAHLFIFIVIIIFLGYYFINSEDFLIGLGSFLITFLFIALILSGFKLKKIKQKIYSEIDNKDEKYRNFLKEEVKRERKEKNWRDSIFE